MTLPLLMTTLLTLAPTKGQLERVVRDRFEAVGRNAPPVDPALSRAADELAQRALEHGVEDAASLLHVTAALSRQLSWDPSPVVVALRASTGSLSIELKKQELTKDPSTHMGVGLAIGVERSALIVLLARRRIELAPFARRYPKPVTATRLCGQLPEGLHEAEVFVTRPDGAVDRMPMSSTKNSKCASLGFLSNGRHAVEVLGSGPRGPEVVALFFVDVGTVKNEAEDAAPEPESASTVRADLLARINALRTQMGRVPVQPDEALEAVAQAWAQRLAQEGFFSHVAPDGSTLKQRLAKSGYAFSAAGENLGLSTGPLAAHFGIEHSPGHRNNILEAGHRRLGLGLATRADGLSVLVEIFARPPDDPTPTDPLASIYQSIAAVRKRHHLSQLERNLTLEKIAQAHVLEALKAESPKANLEGRPSVHEQAFEEIERLAAVSVDVLVTDAPSISAQSQNLARLENRLVGVGVTQGDSRRYGPGRYWIVVVYGVPRE